MSPNKATAFSQPTNQLNHAKGRGTRTVGYVPSQTESHRADVLTAERSINETRSLRSNSLSLHDHYVIVTYALWGGFGLFIGLMLGGVGVVPLAMLATLFKGMWSVFGELILMIVVTVGTRMLGLFLATKARE